MTIQALPVQVKRREKLKRQITRMWVAKLRAQMAGAQAASKHALAEKAAAEAATIGRRLRSRLNCAVGPGGTSVQAAPHLRPKSKVRQAQSQAPAKQAKRVSDARLPSSSQITTEATQGAPLHETVAHSRAKSRLLVGPDEVHSICAQGSSRVQNGPATFGSAAEPNSVIYAKLNGIISLSPGTDPAGIDEPPSMVSYTEQQTCRWCSQTAKCVVCRDCGACYCYQCFRSTKGLGVQGWALSIRQKRFSCKGFQGLEIKQPPCNNADSNGVISISSLQQNAGGEDKMASASDVKRGSADDNNTIARRTRSAAKGQSTPMKLRLARRTSGAPARASGREFERRAADEPPSCELLHDPPLPKRRCVEASASPSEGQSTLSAQGDSRWTIAARIRWGRYRKSPASNLRSCK